MSAIEGPNYLTQGLVLDYDMNNIRSYRGPPISNIANAISVNGTGTSTGYVSTSTVQDELVPGVGFVTTYTNNIQNNYTVYSPNSNQCCPSLHAWGGINVSPSTLYTYAIVFKCTSGYTNGNYMYRYEYASNGGAYVTEGGVYSDARRVSLGDGWFYAWGTFTTNAATNYLGHCGTFYYRYSTIFDNLSIAKVMIVQGDYSGMHPMYWPNSATSRTTAQVLADVSGLNNPITSNSLTYASDGTFSYNGSSNYITYTPNSAFNLGCLSIWYYNNNAIPNNDTPIGGPSTYQTMVMFNGSYPLGVNLGAWTSSMTNEAIHIWTGTSASVYAATYNRDYVAVGWHNTVFNFNGTTYDIWTDGVKTTTYFMSGGGWSSAPLQNITSMQIGYSSPGYYFNGKMPVIQAYNAQLTDAQVLQNWTVGRVRFGI